jgi:hypothetical protein
MRTDRYLRLLSKPTIVVLVGVSVVAWNPGSPVAQEDYLYAGGWDPNVVYEYDGGSTWNPISGEFDSPVLCLTEYGGQVYAGTGTHSETSIGQVWRYDGGMSWALVGDSLDYEVCALIGFRGDLYAGTGWNGGRLYRYDGGNTWTLVVDYTRQPDDPATSWCGFRSLRVWNDIMHMGDLCYDLLGRWDGTAFWYDVDMGGSCIYDFEVYLGELYACAYRGRVHKSSEGTSWTTIRGSSGMHSWELEAFQGELYLSTDETLEKYNGADFIPIWSVPGCQSIVSVMCTPSALILGAGGEAGYTASAGIGRVYMYDGVGVQLISGDMGLGIQAFVGSGVYEPSAVKSATWGEIKARFRD